MTPSVMTEALTNFANKIATEIFEAEVADDTTPGMITVTDIVGYYKVARNRKEVRALIVDETKTLEEEYRNERYFFQIFVTKFNDLIGY